MSGKNSRRTFAVIGLGNFGSTVAKELQHFGNHVIGLDMSEARVNSVADSIAQAMIVDARDDDALREAGCGDCDVGLVAIGSALEASILASINLKMLGVPLIWAKATTKTHHRILSKIGVDRVIHAGSGSRAAHRSSIKQSAGTRLRQSGQWVSCRKFSYTKIT